MTQWRPRRSSQMPPGSMAAQVASAVAILRDTILLGAGLFLARNEFVLRDPALPERPFTIALIGTLLGLPVFLRSDEHRQPPKPPEPPSLPPAPGDEG